MNIKKSIFKAMSLVTLLTFFYYLFYALNEKHLSIYCQEYICFEILSLAEFLALLTAWISLYFVLRSLESWKDSYKFQRAMIALGKFNQLILMSNKYFMYLTQLSNEIQKKN
jgi:hypothetical protein